MNRVTRHAQVPFYTLGNGAVVKVDEGMLDILLEMRRLGLKTQFSCEGDVEIPAYVLMDQISAWKLERLLKRVSTSDPHHVLARRFLNKEKLWDFNISTRKALYFRRRYSNSSTPYASHLIRIERLIQFPAYGLRCTYRWPSHMNDDVLNMLRKL